LEWSEKFADNWKGSHPDYIWVDFLNIYNLQTPEKRIH